MHDVSVLFIIEERPEDYVDECYNKSTQMKIYSKFISLINGANQCRNTTNSEPIFSLKIRRPPGRPHKKRKIKKGSKSIRNEEN